MITDEEGEDEINTEIGEIEGKEGKKDFDDPTNDDEISIPEIFKCSVLCRLFWHWSIFMC